MIKKIKENQYVKLVHELLQNPRTRGIVKLVLWMVFFTIVFACFDVRGSKPKETSYTPLDRWKTEKNYKYQITFDVNEELYIVSGARNGSNEKFVFNNRTYYMDSEFLYLKQDYDKIFQPEPLILNYNPFKLRPEFLNEVLISSKLEYTTNYEDGMVKKGYSINTAKFVELYKGLIISDDSNITIEMVEKNGVITGLELDLIEFAKYNGALVNRYQVTIEYSDFGNVSANEVE